MAPAVASNGGPKLAQHVIVCGLDTLGFRVASELRTLGETVVVLSRRHSERVAALLEEAGVNLIQGSHRSRATSAPPASKLRAAWCCVRTTTSGTYTLPSPPRRSTHSFGW